MSVGTKCSLYFLYVCIKISKTQYILLFLIVTLSASWVPWWLWIHTVVLTIGLSRNPCVCHLWPWVWSEHKTDNTLRTQFKNVVSTHDVIFFNLKNEGKAAICNKVDEPGRHYAQQNKPDTKGQAVHNSSRMENSPMYRSRQKSGCCQGLGWGGAHGEGSCCPWVEVIGT